MSKNFRKNPRQMAKAIIIGILVTVIVDILLVTGNSYSLAYGLF